MNERILPTLFTFLARVTHHLQKYVQKREHKEKSTKTNVPLRKCRKYWQIDTQSTPILGVKTLIPNSHLICLILNPKEPTLNLFLFWFFWFGALIRILLRLLEFYYVFTRNGLKTKCRKFLAYIRHINIKSPPGTYFLVTLNRNPWKLIDWYAAAIDPRTKGLTNDKWE